MVHETYACGRITQLDCQKMSKKKDIESIPRTREEVEKIAHEIKDYLIRLCEDYDNGNTFAIVLVAVLLRTLLKTKRRMKEESSTISVFEQLGLHTMPFVDTSTPKGVTSFWHLGGNIWNHTFLMQNVYGGLLIKKVTNKDNGLNLDFLPLLGANKNSKTLPFEEWYQGVVFESKEYSFTRENCIEYVADKDGGAHLDRNIPMDYYTFRQPTALHVLIDGQLAVFNQNPVYVSVRQIAWEVLESIEK